MELIDGRALAEEQVAGILDPDFREIIGLMLENGHAGEWVIKARVEEGVEF